MITCSYCGSALGGGDKVTGMAHCGFCKMDVKPTVNGERPYKPDMVQIDPYQFREMSTPEIMQQHTATLFLGLKDLRKEAGDHYNSLRIMRKAASENPEYEDVANQAGDQYEVMKRKIFVVENVLRNRLGYIPQRITEEGIDKYINLCRNPKNDKQMGVSKPQQEQKQEFALKKEPERGRELSR